MSLKQTYITKPQQQLQFSKQSLIVKLRKFSNWIDFRLICNPKLRLYSFLTDTKLVTQSPSGSSSYNNNSKIFSHFPPKFSQQPNRHNPIQKKKKKRDSRKCTHQVDLAPFATESEQFLGRFKRYPQRFQSLYSLFRYNQLFSIPNLLEQRDQQLQPPRQIAVVLLDRTPVLRDRRYVVDHLDQAPHHISSTLFLLLFLHTVKRTVSQKSTVPSSSFLLLLSFFLDLSVCFVYSSAEAEIADNSRLSMSF